MIDSLERNEALTFGDFTLTSGKKSHYYVDIKKAVTRPESLRLMVKLILPHVKGCTRIAGVELGAIPLVVALALEAALPYIMIRKSERTHGTGKALEGDLKPGDKVVLVEDVTTTGGSVVKAVLSLREAGAVVDRVVCVVDRGEGADERLMEQGVELIPLVRSEDLAASSD